MRLALVALVLLLLAACSERSISNSGYPGDRYGHGNMLYRGEIEDIDLLAPAGDEGITDARIVAALDQKSEIAAELGQPLLLVQSGAFVPDEEMIAALASHFAVAPFSGRPPAEDRKKVGDYAKRLRLAAAEGGYRRVLVYWGELDTARSGAATKAVSWVPVVGWALPDESQRMRIKLKAAIIDVASGRWRMLIPQPVDTENWSAAINRRDIDQYQVRRLKEEGYAQLAALVLHEAERQGAAMSR